MRYTGQITGEHDGGCDYEIRGQVSVCHGFHKGTRGHVQGWLVRMLNKMNARHRAAKTTSVWRKARGEKS